MILSWLRTVFGKRGAAKGRDRASRTPPARPQVEELGARVLPAVLTVTSAADAGPGTLRQALLDANDTSRFPGLDTIRFAVGSGPQAIALSSALPDVTDRVIIDGTTQPGWGGLPLITLDGRLAGPSHGLVLVAASSAVRGLTVAGFAGSGVVSYGPFNALQGNLLFGNGLDGATVQGFGSGVGGNLLSGNGRSGLFVAPGGSCQVRNNRIGTTLDGTAALGNALDGVSVVAPGEVSFVADNLISGNGRSGLSILGTAERPAGSGVVVNNRIGTDAAGNAAVPNGADGITLLAAGNVLIGSDTQPPLGNLISGNGRSGVFVGGGSSFVRIFGCTIGTNAAGTAALGNGLDGVTVADSGAVIGGGGGLGNLISGNGRVGVLIGGAGAGAGVQGNRIGTNAAGTAALGNAHGGVFIYAGASNSGIGNASDPSAEIQSGNLISGNGGNGVTILGPNTILNSVSGNRIGTNAAGTAPLGNAGDGVAILGGATVNRVGSAGGAARGNNDLIAGNGRFGILIAGPDTADNLVLSARVGTLVGAAALGNASHGIFITDGAHDNSVGDVPLNDIVFDNAVTGNGGDGVRIGADTAFNPTPAGVGNTVTRTTFRANAGLGINLTGGTENAAGVTANDGGSPPDADAGPNNLQNFPVLSGFAAAPGGGTDIAFALSSTPSRTFRVEFFASAAADLSGFGEGEVFLGSAEVTTDAAGQFTGTATVSGAVAAGQVVTATATDLTTGDTSEFSAAFPTAT